MFKFSKLSTFLLASCLVASPATFAVSPSLPDMGTAASSVLTIEKEREYGDAYMRVIRASHPMILDPLLANYISSLGGKLVAHANDVRTPFNFFLIQQSDINAFAFFGGHIGIHSGLFLHAQNESELASVIAHEIAHVTQRHLARSMEEQSRRNPATIAATVGSLLLAIAAPEAGLAALHATTAANAQSQINYTRSNEREADRIGMNTLAKSGYNPSAMPNFFGRMAEQYRYASKPPAMLLTHPLPEERLTESRDRARQLGQTPEPDNQQYALARSRIVARHANLTPDAAMDWFERQLRRNDTTRVDALNYGKVLVHIEKDQLSEAEKLLDPLLAADPYNRFYIDAATDLNLKQDKHDKAIARLEKALARSPGNTVLRLNLIYAYQDANRYAESLPLAQRYTFDYPDDMNGWGMLNTAQAKTGNRAGELAARAELFALKGQWDRAIKDYIEASSLAENGSLNQSIYDARIDQFRLAQQRFDAL